MGQERIIRFSAALLVILEACCHGPEPEFIPPQKGEEEPGKTIELSPEHRKAASRLDSYFTGLHNSNQFNGNVLVARNDTVIFQKSYGRPNFYKKTPLNDSSLFQLASVSKIFTACLILQLAEQDKIDLQADVQHYLPEFPYPGITVNMLLSHRSGLFNYLYFCTESCADKSKKLSNEDIYCLVSSCKPKAFTPGKRFNYNNTNYMLLALIAEKATGKDFKTLMRKNIFDKCGMRHTFFADELKDRPNVCKGYTCSNVEVGGDMFDYVWGDKGVYSTTGDLFLFQDAYFSGKLLSRYSVLQATHPSHQEDKLTNYGFGWRRLYADSVE
jgi:CubicO group peptidase (beta-lactamase class C family)